MTGIQNAMQGATPAARSAASGSSFHAAMRVLPASQRQAMFEIYAFCRAVDDIADGDAPRAERLAGLQAWRRELAACYAGAPSSSLADLAAQIERFQLRRDDFLAVIDGMEMDAMEDIRAPDDATLDLYCDRVASAVGRLAVRVFGLDDDCGLPLAHHLGRALQLTNILRDIDEDAARGRVYLPGPALAAAGVTLDTPAQIVAHPAIGVACAAVAREAQAHYDRARAIMDRCPPGRARSPRIMADVYHGILTRLQARGWSAPRTKVRVPRARLLWIVLRHAMA